MPPGETGAEQRAPDLRNLRWLALLLPVLGVLVGEALRGTLIDPRVQDEGLRHVLAGAVGIGAVVGFTVIMFVGIERAQRKVLQQNRALRIANAVSVAVQGERPLDDVISRALATVVDSTGAIDASVTVFNQDKTPEVHRVNRTGAPVPAGASGSTGATESANATVPAGGSAGVAGVRAGTSDIIAPYAVDVPLATGTALVGQLRLEFAGEPDTGAIPERVLQNIGHQLACAIQMGQLIDDLRRKRRETAALYDVALQVTSRFALSDILGTIVRHARVLLEVDEAIICLSDAASHSLREARLVEWQNMVGEGMVCYAPGDDPISMRHEGARPGFCPVRSSPLWGASAQAPLRTEDTALGNLWGGRRQPRPIARAGLDLLAGMADLAAIAVVSARLREGERQSAILAERERIAREMHDSLAQVLATSHLRLRALEERPEVRALPGVQTEIMALGDLTHDAYRDVREAILGLRESSRADRHLFESLRIYLEKYSRQSNVEARLEGAVEGDPQLPLGAEIQVIRVIQEALTNVRKHSGARHAVVRVTSDPAGVTLTVEDDGRGFDPNTEMIKRDESFGMRTMRERMELVGGTLSVHSAPGQGTRVTAGVPRMPVPTARRIEVPADANRKSHANLAG